MSVPAINWRRFVLGGVFAGLVFNVGGITSSVIMGLRDVFERFEAEPSGAMALLHTVLRFGLGFGAVLVYVGFRTSLGPGWWTAARAGALVWFIGYVPGSVVLNELGVFSDGQLVFGLVWGLGEAVLATVLGASLYRDKSGGIVGVSAPDVG